MKTVALFLLLTVATTLEAGGDAVIRLALSRHGGPARAVLFLLGAVLLFGYGTLLNLAPAQFGRIVGLYIATLFVVWQVTNVVFFKTSPSLPSVIGGTLIVIGGLLVTFWRPD